MVGAPLLCEYALNFRLESYRLLLVLVGYLNRYKQPTHRRARTHGAHTVALPKLPRMDLSRMVFVKNRMSFCA